MVTSLTASSAALELGSLVLEMVCNFAKTEPSQSMH
jgi:hypothetical protein